MTLDFSAMHWLVILSAMAFAYVVFGMVGFGTALVASPILALFVPVAKIVPLLALLDMFAALVNVARDGRKADLAELKRLVPMMAIGSLVGATVLLVTRPDALLLVLGIFVVVYAIYSLSGIRPQRRFSAGASVPFGLVGGVFSALFGSGGFVYSIYLSGRIDRKDQLRITQTTLIGLSTLTRVVLFALAGVYLDPALLLFALALAPAMLGGVFIGRRLTIRLAREQFIALIHWMVLFSGVVLLAHYFAK